MPNNKFNINLLPQEEFNVSLPGRVLHWAMGTFRIIVIVTEMVVMGAFLSRFWLDAQNSDLSSAIKVKSAEITAQSNLEKEFRKIQLKVDVYKNMKQGTGVAQYIDTLMAKVPSGITLTKVTISENEITIAGEAGGELSVSQFMTNLKTVTAFKNIALNGIDSSTVNPNQITFSIKITY